LYLVANIRKILDISADTYKKISLSIFADMSFFYLLCDMRKGLFAFLMLLFALHIGAQRPAYGKMSTLVRQLSLTQESYPTRVKTWNSNGQEQQLCAFVRIDKDGEQTLLDKGCTPLYHAGDIWIVNIPLSKLAPLSVESHVKRIEAGRSKSLTMDSMAIHLNGVEVYKGTNLPQAYTGKGVVVGIQDIGFDLTHPNFYNADATSYRIKALWDQLSQKPSSYYVGADYVGADALLAYQHSRDGNDQTHGTHTLGIAAGGGWDPDEPGKYRGMAYESDICLVANASSEDAALIDSANYYKYTYATDVLGFKYIFDYAKAHNEPCVISFSEGSEEDFRGDDQLYYEMLDSIVGPGRIIVSSAGNNSQQKTYFDKPVGTLKMGSFITPSNSRIAFTLKSASPFTLRLKGYGVENGEIALKTADLLALEDSTLKDTTAIGNILITAYKSCYKAEECVYDVLITHATTSPFSMDVEGEDAEVAFYQSSGTLTENALDASLNAGEATHNIHSPSSAPCVICVGATGYRQDIYTYLGEHRVYEAGLNGKRYSASSIGPTFDGRLKPDVMAPGVNVISSYSSFYLENHPNNWDIVHSDKKHFQFGGRTYAWNYNSGTSMSSPAVAGAIALWLQADPTLTPAKIKEVFSETCSHPDASLSYPNNEYGYGQIDVYKGLLKVLELSNVPGLSTTQPTKVTILPIGNQQVNITFDAPAEHGFSVAVYSLGGQKIRQKSFVSGNQSYQIDLTSLPHGVFAVQVNGYTKATTGSALIRI
jgi:subtilisin family serine protease